MSMDLKNFFDLDKVDFTDSELEAPYEESIMSKEGLKMIELRDIIDLIWVDGDKPIHIITSQGQCLYYDGDDVTEELDKIVTSINVYDNCVEIGLKD